MSRHSSASHFHKSKTLNDKYLLGDEIGKGAYGRVYKGLDLENGDFVAIKQVSLENIPPEDLASIMLEIDLLKNLNHKNIVKYLGSFKTKTHLYIILEYVENGSLASMIKPNKFGAFPESLVAFYIAQVLEGLVYLHEQGVIHRDIKGANILTTKEGLVKLADFGVATKLTEADVNTHSVVGTPYWMAPEVIEMSGVSAASDIWSVGCTVIELLTCVPPYYDLQPMPALFRIVQDDHPPLPEHVSPAITDFLDQCFRKDAKLRPDAKTMLNHPWMRNSWRALQNSWEKNGRIRQIPQDVSLVTERTVEGKKQDPQIGPDGALITRDPFESGSDEDFKGNSPTTSYEASAASSSQSNSIRSRAPIRIPRHAVSHFQRLASTTQDHEQLDLLGILPSPSSRLASTMGSATIGSTVSAQVSKSLESATFLSDSLRTPDDESQQGGGQELSQVDISQRLVENGGWPSAEKLQVPAPADKDDGGSSSSPAGDERLRKKDNHVLRGDSNGSTLPLQGGRNIPTAIVPLSRFRDTPGDEVMDDHFVDTFSHAEEASTSASASHFLNLQAYSGQEATGLEAKLKAKMGQKQVEGEVALPKKMGADLFTSLIDVDEDEEIISTLGFKSNEEGRDYYAKQALEVTRLIGLLKPEESEEVVVSACQKLVVVFQKFPHLKSDLISHHGIIPFMDMLEINNSRVVHAVLQVLNQIIQDNADLLENACFVGMVPAIMSFAGADRSREIRMETAYFVQQLCQTSTLTLQLFIACRGLPVLVGFLEPDYAKYREMVHMAIDGMWQVFEMQSPTPKNDFCRIFAKSGVLVRLVNTLHNLNEATRVATAVAPGACSTGAESLHKPPSVTEKPVKSRSGPLEHSRIGQIEVFKPFSGQLDPARVSRINHPEHQRNQVGLTGIEVSRRQSGQAHKSTGLPDYLRHLPNQQDQPRSHSGQLDPAKVVSTSEQLRHPVTALDSVSPLKESFADQVRGGREDEVQLDGEQYRPLLSEESWALLEPSSRSSIVPVEIQHEYPPSFINLLDKEVPSRPISGQLDHLRHPSDRSESSLPLLHHAVVPRRNGDFNPTVASSTDNEKENGSVEMGHIPSLKAGWNGTGLLSPSSKLSPSSSGRMNFQISKTLSNTGESNTTGVASQTASGVLSASGFPSVRPGSTTSSGLLLHMQSALNPDEAREYVIKVADLLLEFSCADTVVKSHMCSLSLLIRLFQMLNKLEAPILVKILKCIQQLSLDPYTLDSLQRADAMKHLVPFLEQRDSPFTAQIHSQVLNALYNLCKINKRRQEQAAESGIIPHLMQFIVTDSPLKSFALPLLCDMAHASRYTREQLRLHKGLEVYLSLLDDEMWAVTALDSLAACLSHDNDQRKVEAALLKKESLLKLVAFFQSCGGNSFVHILEPFLKIITKSVRLNTSLAVSGLTPLLVARLDHQDAIARLLLLKMIKTVYEHHPRPKQLIVEHDLPSKLHKLIEERRDGERSGGQVLVKQMATALLKALHINTVL